MPVRPLRGGMKGRVVRRSEEHAYAVHACAVLMGMPQCMQVRPFRKLTSRTP